MTEKITVFGEQIPVYPLGTGGIWDPIGQAVAWLYSQLTSYLNPIWGWFEQIKFNIWKAANDVAYNATKTVTDAFNNVVNSIVQALTNTANQILTNFLQSTLNIPYQLATVYASEIQAQYDPIYKIVKTLRETFEKVLNGVYDVFQKYRNNLDIFRPETAFSASTLVLSGLTAVGFGFNTILSLLQTKLVGCGLDLTPLINFINSIMNFESIGRGIFSAIINNAFVVPLGYWVNYTFGMHYPSPNTMFQLYLRGLETEENAKLALRYDGYNQNFAEKLFKLQFKLPSLKDAFRWWRKGIISEQEYLKYAKADGWAVEEVKRWSDDLYFDESPYDLMRLADVVELPESWLRKKLENCGMDEESVRVWLKLLQLRPLRSEQMSYASILRNYVAEGLMSLDEFETELKTMQFSVREIEIYKDMAQRLYAKNILKLKTTAYIYLYRKNQINENELLERLVAAGVDKLYAFYLVVLEAARKGYPVSEEPP